MNEIWVDIKGYEGFYQVASTGRVKRVEGIVVRTIKGTTFEQRISERVLKPAYNPVSGYPAVNLSLNGQCKTFAVHALVAEAFLARAKIDQTQICHNDGNSRNCDKSNLRYDTPKENAKDRRKHGTDAQGVNNPRSVLTEEQVIKIKQELQTRTIKQVSEDMRLNYSTVRSIKQGKNWCHIKI